MTPERKEEIRDDSDERSSYVKWFKDGWDRHRNGIDEIIEHNEKLKEYVNELLAALEEAEIRNRNLMTDLTIEQQTAMKWCYQLTKAQETISRQREALQSIYEESEDRGARHCAAGALGIEWEGDNQ